MKKLINLNLAIAMLALVVACGGSGGGGSPGGNGPGPQDGDETVRSCNLPEASFCVEYVGEVWNNVPDIACSANTVAQEEPCPTENLVGRCNLMEAVNDADSRQYYYEGLYNDDAIESLRNACETANGQFEVL